MWVLLCLKRVHRNHPPPLWTYWCITQHSFTSARNYRCWDVIYIIDSLCLPPTGVPEMVQIPGGLKRPITYRHQSFPVMLLLQLSVKNRCFRIWSQFEIPNKSSIAIYTKTARKYVKNVHVVFSGDFHFLFYTFCLFPIFRMSLAIFIIRKEKVFSEGEITLKYYLI